MPPLPTLSCPPKWSRDSGVPGGAQKKPPLSNWAVSGSLSRARSVGVRVVTYGRLAPVTHGLPSTESWSGRFGYELYSIDSNAVLASNFFHGLTFASSTARRPTVMTDQDRKSTRLN